VALAPTATLTSFYRNLYLGGVIRLDLITGWTVEMAKPASTPALAPGALAKILLDKPALEIDDANGWPIPWLDGFLAHPHPYGFWRRLDLTTAVEKLSRPARFRECSAPPRISNSSSGKWDNGSTCRVRTRRFREHVAHWGKSACRLP
jgi:predicted acyl esterase